LPDPDWLSDKNKKYFFNMTDDASDVLALKVVKIFFSIKFADASRSLWRLCDDPARLCRNIEFRRCLRAGLKSPHTNG
jgi:hypothetical protein